MTAKVAVSPGLSFAKALGAVTTAFAPSDVQPNQQMTGISQAAAPSAAGPYQPGASAKHSVVSLTPPIPKISLAAKTRFEGDVRVLPPVSLPRVAAAENITEQAKLLADEMPSVVLAAVFVSDARPGAVRGTRESAEARGCCG